MIVTLVLFPLVVDFVAVVGTVHNDISIWGEGLKVFVVHARSWIQALKMKLLITIITRKEWWMFM